MTMFEQARRCSFGLTKTVLFHPSKSAFSRHDNMSEQTRHCSFGLTKTLVNMLKAIGKLHVKKSPDCMFCALKALKMEAYGLEIHVTVFFRSLQISQRLAHFGPFFKSIGVERIGLNHLIIVFLCGRIVAFGLLHTCFQQ